MLRKVSNDQNAQGCPCVALLKKNKNVQQGVLHIFKNL